jgi:Ca2+-binding RTX toxin-like protein
VTVDLETGTANVNGSGVSDTLLGISVAAAYGSNDTLIGGAGETTLVSTASGNTLIAGNGSTTAAYAGFDVTVDLASGTATGDFGSDTLIGISSALTSGSGNTLIAGSGAGEVLSSSGDSLGGGGNTLIGGSGAADMLSSSGGNSGDVLVAGSGEGQVLSSIGLTNFSTANTLIGGYGADTLLSSSAEDTLLSNASGNLLEQLAGGQDDVAAYALNNVTVDLETGTATVNGSGVSDVLVGLSIVEAFGSNDTLIGSAGETTLLSNAPSGNTLIAGSGSTVADYTADNLSLDLANGTITDGSASDTLIGVSTVLVSGQNDTLTASSGEGVVLSSVGEGQGFGNTLIGGNSADTLSSIGSGDVLLAGSGDGQVVLSSIFSSGNTLVGGTGSDTLSSSGFGDTLIAGSSANTLIDSGNSNTLFAGSGQTTLIVNASAGATENLEYSAADGHAIVEIDPSNQASVNLNFTDVSDNQLWFQQSGSDLQIDLMGTSNSVTVAGWFSSTGRQPSEITAGGLELDNSVAQLVQAMATYSSNNPSFDPATASQAPNNAALQNSIAAAWHG